MPDPSLSVRRPEYYVQTGSMFENPYGVPHDEIVAMIMELPSEVAAQVIFGKYVESSGLVFTAELIQQMFDRSLLRVTGDRWVDEAILAEARSMAKLHEDRIGAGLPSNDPRRYHFATGIDFARQTDFTVLFTLDIRTRPARVVYYRRLNRVPWETIYREVGRTMSYFGPTMMADATGMSGDVIMDALESRKYCVKHDRNFLIEQGYCMDHHGERIVGCDQGDHYKLGLVEPFQFSASSKKQLLEHLRNTLSVGYRARSGEPFGWLRSPPIVQLEEELSFYAWDDKGLDTDCVMALALAALCGLDDVPQPISFGSIHGA